MEISNLISKKTVPQNWYELLADPLVFLEKKVIHYFGAYWKCRVVWIQGKPEDCTQDPAERCSRVCLGTYGSGVLRSRVWNQDLGSARATVISLVELMFPLSVF